MSVRIYNVGLKNIRIDKPITYVEPTYLKTINRDNIDTNSIVGSYTISTNYVYFPRNSYYSESSYGFNPRVPYTVVLLENTASSGLSQYHHYFSLGGQNTLTCKVGNNGKYIYGTGTTLSSASSSSNMYYDDIGLHIITFGNGITRWASYWDSHAPSILQDNNTRLQTTTPEPLYYGYGYSGGDELKQSNLYELNIIDGVVNESEELNILNMFNQKYGITLRST